MVATIETIEVSNREKRTGDVSPMVNSVELPFQENTPENSEKKPLFKRVRTEENIENLMNFFHNKSNASFDVNGQNKNKKRSTKMKISIDSIQEEQDIHNSNRVDFNKDIVGKFNKEEKRLDVLGDSDDKSEGSHQKVDLRAKNKTDIDRNTAKPDFVINKKQVSNKPQIKFILSTSSSSSSSDESTSDSINESNSCESYSSEVDAVHDNTYEDKIMKGRGDRNVYIEGGVRFSSASTSFFNKVAGLDEEKNCFTQTPSNFSERKRKSLDTSTTSKKTCTNPYKKKTNTVMSPSIGLNEVSINRNEKESCLSKSKISDEKTQQTKYGKQEKKKTEFRIDPSVYHPLPFRRRKESILHYLNDQSRPRKTRQLIPVTAFFKPPISFFWRSKFHAFNHMQSELVQILANSDDNVVVSAPTGAGKTCIFEMAIARLLAIGLTECKLSSVNVISKGRKVLYISPSRALCEERYNDWSTRLMDIDKNIRCTLVTGDGTLGNDSFRNVATAHVIITTPEKWDALTRKWTDHLHLIGSIKLLLIDEVHFLGDNSRGSCLESIICRMKVIQRATENRKAQNERQNTMCPDKSETSLSSSLRILAVSATLPNLNDIAYFLDADECFAFDRTYRPCPLTTHVIGLGYIGKNQYLFDKSLNRHVPDIIRRFSQGKPSIIFCHTKKETEILALELSNTFGKSTSTNLLIDICKKTKITSLQRCLRNGVAYHHAGMESDNRKLVETTFMSGLITCLCATSTLATGINLPSHLVIIKGTQTWRGSGIGHQEIDSATLLQMMGRAGRPGFDTTGTAVIMTDSKSKKRYESLSNGLEVVESKLPLKLIEKLNIEISQQVITNAKHALDWIKGTFFFRRVTKNPLFYGIRGRSEEEIESNIMTKCISSLQSIHELGLISLGRNSMDITPLPGSHSMSQYLVPYDAMQKIVSLSHDSGSLQLLQILSQMKELQYPLRRFEKKILNDIHKLIKYKLDGPPSKVRVQTKEEKTFVLLQTAIGQHYMEDYTLRAEMSMVVEVARRVLLCAEHYSVEGSKHGKVALECLLLRRSLSTSLWGVQDGVLNQLPGVGHKTACKLSMNKIRSFGDVLSHSSHDIEQACGRVSPFGQQLQATVKKLFHNTLSLSSYLENTDDMTKPVTLVCKLTRREGNDCNQTKKFEEGIVSYILCVFTDRPASLLMFRKDISCEGEQSVKCPKNFGRLHIYLISNLVGLDEYVSFNGKNGVKLGAFESSPTSKRIFNKGKSDSNIQNRLIENNLNTVTKRIQDSCLKKKSDSKVYVSGVKTVRSPEVIDSVQIVPENNQSEKKIPPKTLVTPSPTPPCRLIQRNLKEACNRHNLAQSTCMEETMLYNSKGNASIAVSSQECTRDKTIKYGERQRWQKQKQKQKSLQLRAFGSSKENPFSTFKFDPNNIENQLDSSSMKKASRSIFPSSIKKIDSNQSKIHKERCSRFLTNKNLQTPMKRNILFSVGSGRRKRVGVMSSRIANKDLLRLKAKEQQSYAFPSQNTIPPSTVLVPESKEKRQVNVSYPHIKYQQQQQQQQQAVPYMNNMQGQTFKNYNTIPMFHQENSSTQSSCPDQAPIQYHYTMDNPKAHYIFESASKTSAGLDRFQNRSFNTFPRHDSNHLEYDLCNKLQTESFPAFEYGRQNCQDNCQVFDSSSLNQNSIQEKDQDSQDQSKLSTCRSLENMSISSKITNDLYVHNKIKNTVSEPVNYFYHEMTDNPSEGLERERISSHIDLNEEDSMSFEDAFF